MGTAGNALIRGIELERIVAELDCLYAYEMAAACWSMAVRSQLAGPALVYLDDELGEVLEQAIEHARSLAERAAQLGGAVDGDPASFIARSPLDAFVMPVSFADPGAIVSYALDQTQRAIRAYGALAVQVAGKDEVTHRLIVHILRDHVTREDGWNRSQHRDDGSMIARPAPATRLFATSTPNLKWQAAGQPSYHTLCCRGRGQVVVVDGPQVGGEVLPATVGEQRDDLAALHAGGDALCRLHHRARRDAGEDALLLRQFLGGGEGGAAVHHHAAVRCQQDVPSVVAGCAERRDHARSDSRANRDRRWDRLFTMPC
jgi:ferritin-like protein